MIKLRLKQQSLFILALLTLNIGWAQSPTKPQAPKDLEIRYADATTLRTWRLNESFDRKAEEEFSTNKCTNDPRYFDRTFLWKTKEVRELLNAEGAKTQQLSLNDADETVFNITTIDRKSDTLLIIGPGYPVPRERLAPFAKLFPTYDLIFLDYRGSGLDHQLGWDALLPWRWKGALTFWLFDTDCNTSYLGTKEEAEVIATVNHAKKQKKYARVYGLGLCFSSYTFVKAAALQPNLFDKLILDGSWLDLCDVIKRWAANPYLMCPAHQPQSPLPCITHTQQFQQLIITLTEWVVWINLKESKQLTDYLPTIACPIMFMQARDDIFCPPSTFETIWQAATPAPKVAVLTHNNHNRNHLWQKGAYSKLAHWFLEKNGTDFVKQLNQEKLAPTLEPIRIFV